MEKGAILIICFEFNFASSQKTLGFFLGFWAKKSGLKYAITYDNSIINLYVKGDEAGLSKFNDEFITMVPHSIFLQNSNVKIADEMPSHIDASFDFKFNNITPLSLKSGQNEFGFGKNEEFIKSAISDLKAGKSVVFDGFEISKFDGFECDYLLPTNLKTLPKLFVCDEKTLIALASFEKPVLTLKTNAIFRGNHENAPMYFDVRSAWDIDIYEICKALFEDGISFLQVRAKVDFKISVLENSFLSIVNNKFISKEDFDFINSKNDKNLALFGLNLKEFDLLSKTVTRIFLSHKSSDFIKVYKDENEYELLKINTPKSYEEIYEKIQSYEGGDRLLQNYKAAYELPSGEINLPNNFHSLFLIAGNILGFGEKIFDFARDFGGQKGVRIDYKMSSKNEFDEIKFFRSLMSFKLAGAEPKNISFGCFESLAFFISDFGDIIKDEFECHDMLLSGMLFENKTIANLVLKYSNSNYKTRFSEQYGLEIS